MIAKIVAENVTEIDVDLILPNPEQPRKVFARGYLDELAQSIKEHGVIQPINVERAASAYILHDGECRWRSARQAGLKTIPAFISPPLNGTGPQQRLERALVANVQRADMHPIEEGFAYQRLIDEFGYSIADVALKIGKAYTVVYSRLQLLKLEPETRQLMLERKIRSAQDQVVTALLSLPGAETQVLMARKFAEKQLTGFQIVSACEAYNRLAVIKKDRKGSPAVKAVRLKPSGWDALQQAGVLPPWTLFENQALTTCKLCPLQDIASDKTCSDCALAVFVRRMVMEAEHVN